MKINREFLKSNPCWLKTKKGMNNILNKLQRLGKSLMFPIAVLPIAAILLRVGALISDPSANGSIGINHTQIFIGKIISTPGGIVFDNLAIIFAIGVGFGLSKDMRGEVALVSAVVWLGMTALLKEGMLASQIYKNVLVKPELDNQTSLLYFLKSGKPIYQLNSGVVGGIICGGISALLYNRYKDIKLPQSLSFFGGRRFIPMLGVLSIIPLGLFFAIIWPWLQYGLINMGQSLSRAEGYAKGAAAGVYAFFNRILQPFGLHHIINTFVWFQLPIEGVSILDPNGGVQTINGDIPAFQKGIIGSGVFTTGFFPLYLGGLPGAALALVLTSDKNKRKQMALFYGGATLVAFLTGIDEPLIFSFIFISPVLYGLNAVFTGLMYMFVIWTKASIGIGFSAGFIDYVVSFPMSWNLARVNGIMANPLWIWMFSALMFIIYSTSFYFVIKKMKVPTPGREGQLGLQEVNYGKPTELNLNLQNQLNNELNLKKDKYTILAEKLVNIIGIANIEIVENCATRLRLILKSNAKEKVDDAAVKSTGIRGIVRVGNKGYQIIIGTDVEHVANAMKKLVQKNVS